MTSITPTLDGLRAQLDQIEAHIGRVQAMFDDPCREGLLERLMRQYFKPCPEDLEAQSWYDKARERLAKLEAAIERCDIIEAAANGLLKKPDLNPGFYSKMFFMLVELSREHTALKEVLGWLASFESRARSSESGEQVANYLVMTGIEPRAKCECAVDLFGKPWSSPSLEWTHAHHAEYNRAVWEIVNAVPGLMGRVREALQADIARDKSEIISKGEYALWVIDDFLTPSPSAAWFGGECLPSAA